MTAKFRGLILVLLIAAAPLAAAAGGRIQQGKQVFDKWCAPCHAPGAREFPGTVALQVKYNGAIPAALEERTDLTAETITGPVRNGISVMPFFRKTEVSDDDLQALIEYLTSPKQAR
jgi:mono/diheme cytochrome c family protein